MYFGFIQLSHAAERDMVVLFYISQYNKQNKQCMYKHNIEACSHSHCCHWKTVSITYSECVFVALGILHKMCMRHIVTCGSCPALQYFSTLPDKWLDFQGKKVTKHNMCVLSFPTMFIWNISQSEENSARYYHKRKYIFTQSTSLFLSDFNRFPKNTQISNLKKICPMGAELFHEDRWMEWMDKRM
jgi:hypothetical protein